MRMRSEFTPLDRLRWSTQFGIGIERYWRGPDMIGQLGSGEIICRTRRGLAKHLQVPDIPFADEALIDILMALLHVGALHRIIDDVEQERVVQNLEIFPVADPGGALPKRLVAPEQPSFDSGCALSQVLQQIHSVRGIGWVGCRPGSGDERWEPIHICRHLLTDATGGNAGGPRDDRGNAQAAFE